MLSTKHAAFLLFLFFSFSTFAQNEFEFEEDPLLKPKIWTQLKQMPTNEALWQSYFGKDLFDLDDSEYDLFTQWKNQLIALQDEKLKELKLKAEQKKQEYYNKRLGQSYEDEYYRELTENITMNFAMIEEYFATQFLHYEITYLTYEEAHPDDNYSQSKWVEEQEIRLRELEANSY